MTPVRLAVFGFGRWGRNYVRAARESGEAVVSHVVTSTPLHHEHPSTEGRTREDVLRDQAAAEGALTVFGRSGLQMAIEDCDAVVFAAHPLGAAGFAEQVLAAGKPVLVEKPAGLSIAAAERIAVAEAASKTFTLVGHQHLFAEAYEHIREVAEEPGSVTATWSGFSPRHNFPPLWDYGSHAAAVVLGIIGPLWNTEITRSHYGDNEARRHEIQLKNSRCLGQVKIYSYPGIEKIARLDVMINDVLFRYDGYAPVEPPLTRQIRVFARAVRAGGTDDWRFGGRWAVDVAKVLEAAASTN